MRTTVFLTLIGMLILDSAFGQSQEKYFELVGQAWNLYQTKEYKKSAEKYAEAFSISGSKPQTNDRYNAACSWALTNEKDSAFVQLFVVAREGNYDKYDHIKNDADLTVLHADKRWHDLLSLVNINKEKAEAKLDKPLAALLDTIYHDDQDGRMQLMEIEKKYGGGSAEMRTHWKIISEKDSINLIKVEAILDERGWLGPDIVGRQGNMALFLVIQHADIEAQQKYLPMMREAVQNGNARASNLALLEDRIALRNGKKQIYGSQIGNDEETGEYCVLPLIDPDNVNKRRAEVGLGTIQQYISTWGITWDVEAYKKKLSEIEAKQNH